MSRIGLDHTDSDRSRVTTMLESRTQNPGVRRDLSAKATTTVLCAGLWCAVVLSGCSDLGGRTCETDSDCNNNEICADGRCARECSSDDDCEREGYTCQVYYDQRGGGSFNICRTRDAGNGEDTSQSCTSDEDCRERVEVGPGETAFCDPFGDCRIGDIVHAVSIEDTTPMDGRDDGDGAEIAAVFLVGRDEDGRRTLRGRGETLDYAPSPRMGSAVDTGLDASEPAPGDTSTGTDTDMDTAADTDMDTAAGDAGDLDAGDTASPDASRDTSTADANGDASRDAGEDSIPYRSTIDGTRPDIVSVDDECIDGPLRETTPLGGSSGQLLVKFVTQNGERLRVRPSDRIVVIEWGTNCDPEDDEDDRIEVSFCRSGKSRIVPQNDCDRLLGEQLQGYNSLEPPAELEAGEQM